MRVLLMSAYELGHQPLHVAAPAAELQAAGHQVVAVDLAVEDWDPGSLEGVDAVAVSVPMHTALRLAIEVGRSIKASHADLPVAFYGLYAGVGSERTLGVIADRLICGEYEDALVAWVGRLTSGPASGMSVDIGRRRFRTPARHVLPPLDRYAHLAVGDGHKLVGYVEASHGCRHRCAHCPVPAVYDGRYRITGAETVLADIGQLVESGAGHITFGDPDFLNAPAYAIDVLEKAHAEFPHLTFDTTVKVEHVLDHSDQLPRMAESGVIFMISAIETLDDTILERLGKGHTAADAARAVEAARAAGIDIHPTWMPFTPWATPRGVADIARFVWEHDLAVVTDPVQLTIRLLIPDGSLMLAIEDLAPHLTGYDATALGHTWRAEDPEMDRLHLTLATMAEDGSEDPLPTLAAMTEAIGEAASTTIPTSMDHEARPRISEPWFCCAEPTGAQLGALGAVGPG